MKKKDPDPLVRGMDPRIRIHTKMSWIRNTALRGTFVEMVSYFYSGEFQPVTWRCRAPLPSGQLCPRQDRHRCPLHGPIIPRDSAGQPTGTHPEQKTPAAPAKKKRKRDVELSRHHASVYAPPPSARKRIEKKIFQRSVVKRVAAALNASDARRSGAKFGDQFNYALQK